MGREVLPDREDEQIPREDPVDTLFPEVQVPEDHPARRHLGWGQNDAVVTDCRVTSDAFELTFNHYDIWRLASVLDGGADSWRRLNSAFPVTLRFRGLQDLHVMRVVEQGVYQRIRASTRNVRKAVYDLIELRCVHFDDDLQRFIVEMNSGRFFGRGLVDLSWYASGVYVCLECTSLEVEERHREGWIKVFGGKHLDVLDAFESVWPVNGWGVVDFERYVAEHT